MSGIINFYDESTQSYVAVPAVRGPQGPQGVSIVEILKYRTEANIDYYKIILSNGEYTEFTVTNGIGSGDMRQAIYDTNLDGIVDKSTTIVNYKDQLTPLNLWKGTKAEYDTIPVKDINTAYIISDVTYEDINNKVVSLSASSTDVQYPSAKATYDFVLANKSEGLKIEVVQTLPVSDIDTKTLYLVPKQDGKTGNLYDEYIYVNNKWERIGNVDIDLSEYAKKSELPTKVSDLTNDSNFITNSVNNLINYSKTTEFAQVAFDGKYSSLDNLPELKAVATTGSYNDLINKPDLKTVALTGSYNDLINKPLPQTSSADVGKYLSIDSSGNIILVNLPIYDGSVS